jgi:hypothetical protein
MMPNALKRMIVCLSLSIGLLMGCRPKKIAGNYCVEAIDTKDDTSLYYVLENGDGVGRIEPRVVSVGWDTKHIIAKRIVKARTDPLFYIVEIEKDHALADPEDVVTGPLSEEEFWLKRKQLNVSPSLEFTVNY